MTTLEEKLEFLVQEESEASEELRVYEGKLKSQKDSTASKQKFIAFIGKSQVYLSPLKRSSSAAAINLPLTKIHAAESRP